LSKLVEILSSELGYQPADPLKKGEDKKSGKGANGHKAKRK